MLSAVQTPLSTAAPVALDGRRRAIIGTLRPCLDGGQFPIKRVRGESVAVEATVFCDGHDQLRAWLCFRPLGQGLWQEVPMVRAQGDCWRAEFTVRAIGLYEYAVCAWVDRFLSWRHDLLRRTDAADIGIALQVGAELLREAASRARDADAAQLEAWAARLQEATPVEEAIALSKQPELDALMARYADRQRATWSPKLQVQVDIEKAAFSTWYELFPRSCGQPGEHGSLRDCLAQLPRIAKMGFDVLYLPPIHPIGRSQRKGKNNSVQAAPDDTGSPWAIGAQEGGHKSLHPQLGSMQDFRELVSAARGLDIDIALDIALQCAPDHPYVSAHPEWFQWRPDHTVQYAENPPKKYQDIFPFNFESVAWQTLWEELRSIFLFWAGEGVRIFRVDNPHTKPIPFWQWLIAEVKRDYPETIFLAEAFTRPSVMLQLAKIGFSQSYTYFAWRNTKAELTEYFTELTQTEVREYFRPNAWPNTPDILTEYLQYGGRPAFMARLVLAATLCANYGIYGPPYEVAEGRAVAPGSEEYLDSEKYQIRHWPLDRRDSLGDFIARVNRIRHDNPALQRDASLRFYQIDNPLLIAYAKSSADGANTIVVVVNLDPHHTQGGWLELPTIDVDVSKEPAFQVHDLLSDVRYLWQGNRNWLSIDPQAAPAQIFRLRRRVRSERDFDYFL